MKYLGEYRDEIKVKKLLEALKRTVTRDWNIMEICGGQTHSLVKNGILELLPDKITMIHGPGCPVCVTPASVIDQAVTLALKHEVILCSYGDMLRVPGNYKSLITAKAEGADVRMVYSPLDSLQIAVENPDREVVFLAVGFETTAPAHALTVVQAGKLNLENFSILSSHVLVPPAMSAILNDEDTAIDGFLAAGHVCTVMGTEEYEPVTEKYRIPIIITGFEPVDLLQGILSCVSHLENSESVVENQYKRVVKAEGNIHAKALIFKVFKVGDREWRGIGSIPDSGLVIRPEYEKYNAEMKFSLRLSNKLNENGCIAGQILKGIKKPTACLFFRTVCTPANPMGAPMVSSEGACAAYYQYGHEQMIN